MKAIGLLRVSTAEQTIENQRIQLERWADAAGVSLEFRDEPDTCGASKERPVLEQIMAEARRGRVRLLVVAALDRLGRSAIDTITRLAELRALNVRVVSLREGVDFGTPIGAMVASILAHLAEMERESIRERTRAGMARVAAHAARYGVASHIGAPGYKWRPEDDAELLRRDAAGQDAVAIVNSCTFLVPKKTGAKTAGGERVKGQFVYPLRIPSAQTVRDRLKALRARQGAT